MSRFGDNLKEARTKAGFTQESLAKEIGVLGQTIYRWEAGTRSPRVNIWDKLANALNITVAQLVGSPEYSQADHRPMEGDVDIAAQQIKLPESSLDGLIQASGRCSRPLSLTTRLVQIRDEIKDNYGKIDEHDRSIIKATLAALEADIAAIENTEKERIAEATQKMA